MKRTVIKIGGELAGNQELLKLLASEVGKLRSKSDCLLVHGGGAELSDMMRNVGIEPHFKDGVRQTSPQEMKYVDMVLSGMINKRIVRCFQFEGIDAVGLSGSDGCLFVGDRIGPASHTGEISNVDTTLIDTLMRHHYFPVISSTSMNSAQQIGLNINADSVAFRLAEKMCADCLVFISNIPGNWPRNDPARLRAIPRPALSAYKPTIAHVRLVVGQLLARFMIQYFRTGGAGDSVARGRVPLPGRSKTRIQIRPALCDQAEFEGTAGSNDLNFSVLLP